VQLLANVVTFKPKEEFIARLRREHK